MTDQPQDPTPTPSGDPVPPAAQPPQAQPPAQPSYAPPARPSYPPPAPNPYAPQAQNPYGGYSTAPAYAASYPPQPGSLAFVEQHFGRVADFGQRVLAQIVDALLGLVSLVPIVIAIPFLIAGAPKPSGGYDAYGYPVMGDADAGQLTAGFVLIALGMLLGLALWVWNRIVRMGRTGQSLGKSVVGLRLIDARSGQPIGPGQCFLRELLSIVINQAFYLSYLWMLWDDNRQTLADKVVTSTVIVVPKR